MNKLAAGALALALGLGAVAPAVAAESKYSGAELVLEQYEKELKEVNKKRDAALAAQAKIDAAKKRLDAAKKKVAEAEKAYKAQFPLAIYKSGSDVYTPEELNRMTLNQEYSALNKAFGWAEIDTTPGSGDLRNVQSFIDAYVGNTPEAKRASVLARINATMRDNTAGSPANNLEKENKKAAVVAAVEAYHVNTAAGSNAQQLYNNLVAALAERTAAQTEYDSVYAVNHPIVQEYDDAFVELNRWAQRYGYVVQVANNGLKLVKDGEDKIKAPGKKATRAELIKELKAEVDRNKAAVASAEFLLKYTPKTVAKVEGKLKAQIVEAKAAIEKAEKALEKVEKKAAFIATAYADDEEVSDEDLESLIKDNKESADNLENTMKENEKAQPEVEEEKKPEEKKPEEKTPSKKAGNNARTGIAGVAGVAGILAAASVAYAASKRD